MDENGPFFIKRNTINTINTGILTMLYFVSDL